MRILSVLLIILAVIVSVPVIGGVLIMNHLSEIPDYDDYRSALEDRFRDGDAETPDYMPYETIPKPVIDAFVARNDPGFFEPRDPSRLDYFISINLRPREKRVEPSHISLDLARRMMTGRGNSPRPGSMEPKLTAIHLEQTYGRKQILEMYLNQLDFSGGIQGLGPAIRTYLDLPPASLGIEDAATLVALSNIATSSRGRDKGADHAWVLDWRNGVLKRMGHDGAITEAEAEQAIARPLRFRLPR